MRAYLIHFFVVVLLFTFIPESEASNTPSLSLQQQRQIFQDAREAIRKGQHTRYQKLAKKIPEYPLHPYLEYWELNRNLSKTSNSAIQSFLDTYQDTSLSDRLRYRWLEHLAKRNRWQTFIDFYQPTSDTEMECYYRRALYKTGAKERAFENLEEIWLKGKSQPRACDPLFTAWQEAGKLTPALAWQRVQLAMENNQSYLARYLERYLDNERAEQTQLWRQAHRRPQQHISDPRLRSDTAINRQILAHSVRRIARRNASAAAETWNKLVMKYSFEEHEYEETESYIAVALALQKSPEALHWLSNLPYSDNESVIEWRIVATIYQEQWDDTLYWIEQLSYNDQQTDRWIYWRARALEEEQQDDLANELFTKVAQNRSYYGFLAADRLGLPYQFEDYPLRFPEESYTAVKQLPAVERAKEFYILGDILNARREWYNATQAIQAEELPLLAQIAHQWGWHDRAIYTLGRANYMDDLEIRFPLAHKEQVINYSNKQNIDPSWSYAVIRQESAFASDARSPKGAMGLMQIMPKTGQTIARTLKTKLKNSRQLLEVDTNIRFGVNYLRKVMNRFDDNTVLATAAYNAGSQRVKSWLPEQDSISPDIWIESVPFKETRNYLKQVLAYTAIYDKRLENNIKPLKARMPEITAKPPSS